MKQSNPIEEYKELYKKEKWQISPTGKLIAYDKLLDPVHPYHVHCLFYRQSKTPQVKFNHLKSMYEYAYPQKMGSFNYWLEDRMFAHCEGWEVIGHTSGGNTGKSHDLAYISYLDWDSDKNHSAVVVTSTTLSSIDRRVWGYMKRAHKEHQFKQGQRLYTGNMPRILMSKEDTIHGIFAIAAKTGSDEKAIQDIIGHHPDRKLILILDECPDMPVAIYEGFSNLRKTPSFIVHAIGNASDENDLHGILCRPEVGLENLDYANQTRWKTTQKNGICLYYNPYNSPAIHEPDPKKRQVLSQFLPTLEKIEETKKAKGEQSKSYLRMELGQWQKQGQQKIPLITPELIAEAGSYKKAEFSGLIPLRYVAALDPAFTQGGDKCILQLGVLGVNTDAQYIVDFRKQDLRFELKLSNKVAETIESQIATQVIAILDRYQIPLNALVIDSNGQGRSLGEVIRMKKDSMVHPIRIHAGNHKIENQITYMYVLDMWQEFQEFLQAKQIYGLDQVVIDQLTTRLLVKQKNSVVGKKILEPKPDYKKRMGALRPDLAHSPDEADATVLCLQSAILALGFTKEQRYVQPPRVELRTDIFPELRLKPQGYGGRTPLTPSFPRHSSLSFYRRVAAR